MCVDRDVWAGLLWGAAIGDSLGLPAEGLSPQRARALLSGRWRQRFFLGKGMISDDTEHLVFVAQCLLRHPEDVDAFCRRLAWCLRGRSLGLPAGVGMASARACLRLLSGRSPKSSGVFSAGNGPAMRIAPIGAFFCRDPQALDAFVEGASRLTHTDPKAVTGARAIALLTAGIINNFGQTRPELGSFLELLGRAGDDLEWLELLGWLRHSLEGYETTQEFAVSLGLETGVTGYIYHTVPVVVHAVYRHWGDFEAGLTAILACGGDADTTGSIGGAILGAICGVQGLPKDWRAGLLDWPRGGRLLDDLANRLAKGGKPVTYPWWGCLPRNLLFLSVVLFHGFRRLAPPYR